MHFQIKAAWQRPISLVEINRSEKQMWLKNVERKEEESKRLQGILLLLFLSTWVAVWEHVGSRLYLTLISIEKGEVPFCVRYKTIQNDQIFCC